MTEAPIIPKQEASHGSESEKPYQRACLRDLGRTWPSGRSSRSALAGGGTGSARGIDGGARPKIRAAKEKVRCAAQEAARSGPCEDQQYPRRGKLTPRNERPWFREHGTLNEWCAPSLASARATPSIHLEAFFRKIFHRAGMPGD